MTNKFFILLGCAGLLITWFTVSNTQPSPESLWGKEIAKSYLDEPTIIDSFEINSSSGWIVPSDPLILEQLFEDGLVTNLLDGKYPPEHSKEETDGIWNQVPGSKEILYEFITNNNLSEDYMKLLYKDMQVPFKLVHSDLTKDELPDEIILSSGVGCASCHTTGIYIISKDRTFFTNVNEGEFKPRSDKNGFYITNAYTDKDYATCCPNTFKLSKFSWNGNGFTEIARKTINVSYKESN